MMTYGGMVCERCRGTEFYVVDGLYFCEECHIEAAAELEQEEIFDKIKKQQRIKNTKKAENLKGWTF